MSRTRKIIIAAGILLAVSIIYFRWTSRIQQPLEFSHAQHVKKQIPCASCHPNSSLETLPTGLECRKCHMEKNFPPEVQWAKVYRVAPDIIFSHSKHMDAPCSTCHEKFTKGSRWIHESRFKMSFCMDCHDETRASNECKTCHINK